MKTKALSLIMAASACFMLSCDNGQRPDADAFSTRTLPIINGIPVSGDDHLATVALVLDYGSGTPDVFCTGTLITPNYVLTASHCISYCQGDDYDISQARPYMAVAIGQSEATFRKIIPIQSFHAHPQFVCSPYLISNDIAILKLAEPVSLAEVTPILPMPPTLDMTPDEVDDSTLGVDVTIVGFGKTDPNNDYSSGKKYKTNHKVYAYCPTSGDKSKKCGGQYTNNSGFIYFNANNTGTCQGDSGGPTFVKRDGVDFVAGVTSYGYNECRYVAAMTIVSEHFDFISGIVDDMAADSPEICDNHIDDNGDNRVDCADPYCFVLKQCVPEDCSNKKDDNENGFMDCEDSQCQNELICQPEDCTNKLDDNGNGLIDCDDTQCFEKLECVPENCANNIDDNGNGLIDCAETEVCGTALHCQPEICDNRRDDNGDDLIDCDDPDCEMESLCIPEICDDRVDNNGDTLVDCIDSQCRTALICQPERCHNKVDDNGNGLADCQDPACASELKCQPEICDDKVDNNDDTIIDCDDPNCTAACESASSSCSATPHNHTAQGAAASLLTMILGLLSCTWIRRRRGIHQN